MKACAPVSVHSSQDVVRLPNKVAVVFPTGSLYVLLHLSLCLQGFDAFSVLIMITFIIIIIIIIDIYLFIKKYYIKCCSEQSSDAGNAGLSESSIQQSQVIK